MEKVKQYSVNCGGCGSEYANYQVRPAKIGNLVMDLCKQCQGYTETYHNYKQAADLLSEISKIADASGPNIVIEPVEPLVQKAVDVLKRMDSNYFSGVSKIVLGPSNQYGHVQSGADKDPTVININSGRIKQEAKNDVRTAILNIAIVIAHERAHVKSYKEDQGFVGGESPAQAEETKVSNWIKNNKDRIEDLLK